MTNKQLEYIINNETNTAEELLTKEVIMTADEQAALYVAQLMIKNNGNKSETMRNLLDEGYKQGRIARLMNVRHQFVNNVARAPRKKSA